MVFEELGQSTELNSYHRDVSPGLCAGFSCFVISDQATMTHEPGESALYHPAPRQDLETSDIVRTPDDLHLEFRAQVSDPFGESGPGIAGIRPEQTQPGKYGQCALEQGLRSVPFGGIGRSDNDTEQEAECIDQDMSFAPLDALGRVIPNVSAVGIGFDALAIEDRCRRTTALAFLFAYVSPQASVQGFPGMIEGPLTKDVVDGFPTRKIVRQESPLNTAFDDIKDGIDDLSAVNGRSPCFAWFRKHRFKQLPLSIGQTRVVKSDFHRFNGAALLMVNALAEAQSQSNSSVFLALTVFRRALNDMRAQLSGDVRRVTAHVDSSLAIFA